MILQIETSRIGIVCRPRDARGRFVRMHAMPATRPALLALLVVMLATWRGSFTLALARTVRVIMRCLSWEIRSWRGRSVCGYD